MTSASSLKVRLLLAFGAVLILAVAGPGLYFGRMITEESRTEAATSITRELHTIHWTLKHLNAPASLPTLNSNINDLARASGVRITFIESTGRVILDSATPLGSIDTLDNHASRPEVSAARRNGSGTSIRHSGTLNSSLVYAAVQAPALPGLPPGILRIAAPYARTEAFAKRLYGNTPLVLGVTFCLGFILFSLVLRNMNRSLQAIVTVAGELGQGAQGKRIRVSPAREFDPLVSAFNQMAKRIEHNIATITTQKKESEAILNGMRAGVMVVDGEGKILRGNYALEEIFPGIHAFAGKNPLEAVLITKLQHICEQALHNRERGDFSQISTQIEVGSGRYFEVSVVPVQGEKTLGAILVFHDITEIKRVEKIRRDFVANVSHELRTPLTSIKGYSETLLSMPALRDGQEGSFLNIILRNANNMNKMLDELLQLSRIEARREAIDLRPVDVPASIYSAWKSCEHIIAEKNISYENLTPRDLSKIKANSEQAVQVFRNILENAVKYVAEETGTISVRAEEDAESVTVTVTDNGPGIPEEDQSRIFERFYRVEKHRNSKISGTGLGLAICRHILLNHGGTISVVSPVPETGTGSRFVITFPKAE
ncbi:MAG TPA: ATP-binding protein [Desulfomicrobiaceae bacterium]|nr:ATP-binding protein [Desulfomicrobiaceae bacterium]